MKQINLGTSRYGDRRQLHEKEVGKYSTEGFKNVHYIRVQGRDDGEEGFSYLDFEGGPMLTIGLQITKDEKITHIKFKDGKYLIYTDKYVENNRVKEPQDRDQND